MADVFVSYSWDSEPHKDKVASLVEHLRTKGFDATMDRILSQAQTATNFVRMMHDAMLKHAKVIVVLSAGYKHKAESFTGGVGEEYQLLINDIQSNSKKYILASFDGRHDDVVPYGLRGRDVIDLTEEPELERLYRKLMDQPDIIFSAVAPMKPALSVTKPLPLSLSSGKPAISIFDVSTREQSSSLFAGLYNTADLDLSFDIKNESSQPIAEYSYEVRVNKYLDPEYYKQQIDGDEVVYSETVKDKLFSGQSRKSRVFRLRLTANNISSVLSSNVLIRVYSAVGTFEKAAQLVAIVKLHGTSYGNSFPLTRDLFA